MSEVMWSPTKDKVESTNMYKFMKDLGLDSYKELHKWSVDKPDQFWNKLITDNNIIFDGDLSPACTDYSFKTYGWYPNVRLNFAENLLRFKDSENEAINFVHESGLKKVISYKELAKDASRLQNSLKEFISEGDVVAAYMPNISETVVTMLATTSLGGVFTSTSSDFGIEGVLDRFGQSKPKVLVAACGYEYNGKYYDVRDRIESVAKELDFIEKIICVDFVDRKPDISNIPNAIMWNDFLSTEEKLVFKKRKFSDPLYIMYSSGTTGKPKCIVHSIGGTLLQHVKELGLHTDLEESKRIFYFTTCGWMMWNWLVSSLFFGSSITLYDGSPGYPSLGDFFKIIDREKLNIFGTSPKFLKALEDSGYNQESKLDSLDLLMSTGAPLLPEQFDYIYKSLKKDVQVASICGGTDIIGCFMLGNPISDVRRGEIQSLGLGMDVACFSDKQKPLIDSEGELVCKHSFPSRPIYFLNDKDNERLNSAYFNKFENIWHHGDFITITKEGSVNVFGRSDATLNPGGVRIGTAEIYRQTESLPYLLDSLCVGKNREGDVDVVLFVKLKEDEELTDSRIIEIKKLIKNNTTPRHVPQDIYKISDIPYTRSGKKMELAIARIVNNRSLTNIEAVANPECLEQYKNFCD